MQASLKLAARLLSLLVLAGLCSAAYGQIQANDYTTPSYFEFDLQEYRVAENATNLMITVFRNGDFRTTASVDYEVVGDTATEGQDFKATGGRLVFPAGQTYKTIIVPVIADNEVEGDETAIVQLSNPSANAEIGQESARIVITDAPAELPKLSIRAGARGFIVVAWAATSQNLILERANAPDSTNWEIVASQPALNNGEMIVQEPIAGDLHVYRLRVAAE